jgi:hypothetical protein
VRATFSRMACSTNSYFLIRFRTATVSTKIRRRVVYRTDGPSGAHLSFFRTESDAQLVFHYRTADVSNLQAQDGIGSNISRQTRF